MDDKLQKIIEKIQSLRKKDINESQTKEWLIRPFFEYLGWDFSNPDEVVPEDNDSTGKRPDYTFLINNEKKILIEAKAINNTLDDPKMINEKMNYCSNSQVPFLIITNGEIYKIFYAKLDGPNTEKVLFDFILNDDLDEETIARINKENVKNDILLNYAKKTFILTNIKKTLESSFQNPSKKLITIISENMKQLIGYSFSDNEILESIKKFTVEFDSEIDESQLIVNSDQKINKQGYSVDDQFNNKKWIESYELYLSLIKSLGKNIKINEKPTKVYIGLWTIDTNKNFCQIQGQRKGLRVWLSINMNLLTEQEKLYAKDVSNIGHHGIGNTEISIKNSSDFNWCINLIIKTYNENNKK